MKMRLYYVAQRIERDEFHDTDFLYEAGPFATYSEAVDARCIIVRDRYWSYGDFEIASTELEVKA